jgi:hypothetical protein
MPAVRQCGRPEAGDSGSATDAERRAFSDQTVSPVWPVSPGSGDPDFFFLRQKKMTPISAAMNADFLLKILTAELLSFVRG